MRILIVGLGGIGQRHSRNLRSVLPSGLELLAFRTRGLTQVIGPTLQADPVHNVERELDLEVFSNLEAALARRPQIAFICNPTSLHVPIALACVKAGCDLFIEKPLSHSLDGIDELMRVAADTRRVAMVGYQLRFHPCVRTLASVIEKGSLGQLLAVRAVIGEFMPKWHPYEDYRNLYAARSDLGGGVVLSQIHEFDYLQALFGPIRSVYAVGGHWSHLEIDVEDVASVLMEGTTANRSLAIHVHQDYLQNPPVRQCEVIGDRGRAIADFGSPSVTVYGEDGQARVHTFANFERNQLFVEEIQHFLACVQTRNRPLVDLQEGLQSLRIALAAKQSMSGRRVIDLSVEDTHSSLPAEP